MSIISGRAKLGQAVTPRSATFRYLLALEEALYQMIRDRNISARPLTSPMSHEDYNYSQKVCASPFPPLMRHLSSVYLELTVFLVAGLLISTDYHDRG
jgi:hypothetical protein